MLRCHRPIAARFQKLLAPLVVLTGVDPFSSELYIRRVFRLISRTMPSGVFLDVAIVFPLSC